MNESEDVLSFWFEGIDDQILIDKKKTPFKKWFSGGRLFDQDVGLKFGRLLNEAFQGQWDHWQETSRGGLALILLYDQLARNAFRNMPVMYTGDAEALRLSLKLIEAKDDLKFLCVERLFIYMPLMHAENLSMQAMSVKVFGRLVEDIRRVNPANEWYYIDQLNYAREYFSIIERFGRFPHRNNILSRPSTAEELRFLQKSK